MELVWAIVFICSLHSYPEFPFGCGTKDKVACLCFDFDTLLPGQSICMHISSEH